MFYRVGKRPPVKADLAIYSLIVGMSGQRLNVATMLNNKLDFYCCDNWLVFANPVTIEEVNRKELYRGSEKWKEV